jgi:hypothetical protein
MSATPDPAVAYSSPVGGLRRQMPFDAGKPITITGAQPNEGEARAVGRHGRARQPHRGYCRGAGA